MKADVMRALRGIKSKPSLKNRRAGDDARDRGDWPAAEESYAAHLALVPEDQPIWVQYGHALKEQGKTDVAEAAYRKAGTLRPDDADVHVQLGHLLSSLGRMDEAESEYVAAAHIRPALSALVNRGATVAPQSPPAPLPETDDQQNALLGTDTIFLEIDDLLDYLRSHRTVSGIQRVQVGIVTHAVAAIKAGDRRYRIVRTARSGRGFMEFVASDIAELLDYIRQPNAHLSQLRKLIESAEECAMIVQPQKDHLYFVLGAFWGFNSNPARYSRLKSAGVRVGVYIYDLIPITHPEYCALGLVNEFTLALGDGLHAFDFVLTISEYVAQSMRDYIAENGLRPIPIKAVPLAHSIHDDPIPLSDEVEAAAWEGALASLYDREFVLVVCTIEPRKNHAYLYWLWRMLADEGLDLPDLVFVGRFGWRVNDFHSMLTDTEFMGGRIHVLHDLSDVDLELLYRSCLFTAFPSLVEGWGLPVGESLSHGRPIIASNTTSIPEVGGDFVDYIDPYNLRDGAAVFKRMIVDEQYREQRSSNIRDNFVPRTWDDVAKDLLGELVALRRVPPMEFVAPTLRAGELFVPGNFTPEKRVPDGYAQRPLRPILANNWFSPENFGVWMTNRKGSLRFTADSEPGTRIAVYVQLTGAPWVGGHSITIYIGEKPLRTRKTSQPGIGNKLIEPMPLQPDSNHCYSVVGEVGLGGVVEITIEVSGPDVEGHPKKGTDDARVFYVGMRKLAYAPASDMELRANTFEAVSRAG